MSWSKSYGSKGELERNESTVEGSEDQVSTARDAARGLIESGAVGDPDDKDFSISLSGHSNPGHEPTAGMANDTITISVSQKGSSAPAKAPPEPAPGPRG